MKNSADQRVDGLDLFGDPRPELLADVAQVEPEPGRKWVAGKRKIDSRSSRCLSEMRHARGTGERCSSSIRSFIASRSSLGAASGITFR